MAFIAAILFGLLFAIYLLAQGNWWWSFWTLALILALYTLNKLLP